MTMAETTENQAPTVPTMIPTESERAFALAQRQATALANSDLVPKEFRDNVANCLIALNLAQRVGCDPLMAMQNLDVIHGRPSWRATFLIACLNKCGRFTPLRYRITGEGDERVCIAVANDKETGEEIEGPPVSMEMARLEGWSTKNGSKWQTMPDLMLRYRAAAFFARTCAPEVAMGLYTADEVHDMQPEPAARGASATSAAEALENAKDITPPSEAEDGSPDGPAEDPGAEARESARTTDEGPPPDQEPDDVDAAFGLSGEKD